MVDLDNKWKDTCAILLGAEIGDLQDYENYLRRFVPLLSLKQSKISNKDVFTLGKYPTGTKFISADEHDLYQSTLSTEKLDINQIKDLDSLVGAILERVCCAGNIHIGNTFDVTHSDHIFDSSSVYHSSDILWCKNISHSAILKYSENIFGSHFATKVQFAIHSFALYESSRIFEAVRIYFSSDCYYSSNLEGCQNCMFSFNLRNKHNCIGNLELSQDKYASLKSKILEEIRETLKSKKSVLSVIDLIGGSHE